MKELGADALDDRLREFLSEDIGRVDVTTETTVPAGTRTRGELVARSECVVSGLAVARRVFELLDPEMTWQEAIPAGARAAAAAPLARLEGRARAILTAERVALNLLQRMCGIATATRRYVDALAGTRCQVLDTRKTVPGLRFFDRQAVRVEVPEAPSRMEMRRRVRFSGEELRSRRGSRAIPARETCHGAADA